MRTLDQARELYNDGNFQEVDAIFEEILQQEPENSEVIFMLAKSQMNQNKLTEALQTIDRALALNSEDAEFSQIKGTVLTRLGKIDEAIEALKKSLQNNPNNYQSQNLMGHLNYQAGNRDEAFNHFNMALKIDADRVDAQINLIRIMMDEGDVERAIKKLGHMEKQFPNDPTVKMTMGQALIENQAYSFAEKYFEKVREILPEYSLARLYLGIAKLYNGDDPLAQKIIIGYNQKYPNIKEGLAAMGLMFFKQQHFKAAHDFLNAALKEGPAALSWRKVLAESKVALGQMDDAVEFYQDLTKKYNNPNHRLRLAELLEMNQSFELAMLHYGKIDKTDVKYVSALLGLARCHLRQEDYQNTEQVCKTLLELHQQSPEAMLLLVNALLFQDKTEEAIESLEKINYNKLNAMFKKTFRVLHAMVLDHEQRFEEAMSVFIDEGKMDKENIPALQGLSEQTVKNIQQCKTTIGENDALQINPVFVVGTPSTDIHDFCYWLSNNGITVLNDRLISQGREDVFSRQADIDIHLQRSETKIAAIRQTYGDNIKAILPEHGNTPVVDCLYTNPV